MGRTNDTQKCDMARSYRRKHGMDMPTLKLARIMHKENNLLFKDVEDARARLRYIEGKSGKGNIKNLGANAGDFVMTEPRPRNPYNLPNSDAEDFTPFVMPFYKKVFIINDVHLPYHDIPA